MGACLQHMLMFSTERIERGKLDDEVYFVVLPSGLIVKFERVFHFRKTG